MKSQTLTFCQLIEQHGCIRIPMLQRDYAQGRDSASELRELFLGALFEALEEDSKPLTLDFVYGSKVGGFFSPLDGQQRLTTLFLLHWYLAQKEGQQEDFQKRMKRGDRVAFTYETRPSSRDFFTELTSAVPETVHRSQHSKISEKLMDQKWFMLSWQADPTIRSALKMLDAISASSAKIDRGYLKLVSDACPIVFHAFDLGAYSLAEDLYVKMNSRGKPLTAFESFKARLEEKIVGLFPNEVELPNGKKGTFKAYFSQQIDRDWLDFFWNYFIKHKKAEDKALVPDGMMMKLVREVAVLALVLETGEDGGKNLTLLRDPKRTPTPHDYEKVGCLNKTFVTLFSVLLQRWSGDDGKFKTYLLADNCPCFNEEDNLGDILNKDALQTYTRSVTFYGYAFYLERHQGLEIDPARFSEWMRVVHNLVENTRCNDEKSFSKCLNGVRTLADQADHILEYLAADDPALATFDVYQVREERLKAGLILSNPIWRRPILDAEKHGYFCGQIGFLFQFCGIEKAERESDTLLTQFEEWRKKSAHCFSKEGIAKDDKYRWERALLAEGDYLLLGGTHLLSNARSDDFNWKRLLRGKDGESEKGGLLKALIERVNCEVPVEDQLEAFIKAALEKPDLDEWRRLMIQWPGVIGFCRERRIRREEGGKRINLLQSTDYRGHWAEIWAYALHLKLRRDIATYGPFQEAGYYMGRGDNSCAWVVWRTKEYGDVALSVERPAEDTKFTFLRWHWEPLDKAMIQVIEGLGFKKVEGGRYEISINDKSKVENFIKDVAEALRGFQPVNCSNE